MKAQMRFQKILSIVSLVIAALSFVYALYFLTGSLGDVHYYYDLSSGNGDTINCAEFKSVSQQFVTTLIALSITFIVLAVLLFITASNKRRNYYVTNYIAVGLFVVFAIVIAIYSYVMIAKVQDLFLNKIFWDAGTNGGKNVADQWLETHPIYRTDTNFIIGYVYFAVVLVNAIVFVLSTVWKILLMRGEKKLLASSAPVQEVKAEEVA